MRVECAYSNRRRPILALRPRPHRRAGFETSARPSGVIRTVSEDSAVLRSCSCRHPSLGQAASRRRERQGGGPHEQAGALVTRDAAAALVPPRRKATFRPGPRHHSHSGPTSRRPRENDDAALGEQWTTMRREVFDALASFDRPASATTRREGLAGAGGGTANSSTAILDVVAPTSPEGEAQSLVAKTSGLPARLHLPDLRQLRPDRPYRR